MIRSWNVKGPIKTFFVLKEPFKIGDCTIERENGKMVISVNIEAEDEDQAEKIALKRIRKALLSWSLTTNEFLDFDDFLSDIVETTPGRGTKTRIKTVKANALLIVNHLKPNDREEAQIIHKLLEKSDEHALRAAEYYQKGLALRRWWNDAFLNFYKANELIFKKYHHEAQAAELRAIFHKRKRDLTAKEKMKYMCMKLDISRTLSSKVDDIVDTRNRQDVAHASLTEGEIGEEITTTCREIAKQVIINYLRIL